MRSAPAWLTSSLMVRLLLVVVVIPFLPLLITARWGWWEAWVYALLWILGFVVSRGLVARRHPDLLEERARSLEHHDVPSWDKVLAPMVGLGVGGIPLVAGLEALVSEGDTFVLPVRLGALALLIASYLLASYALLENRYFSGVVRLQRERGHQVVASGPYAWIRHPGYSGAMMTCVASPIFLDSGWAFIPAVLVMGALLLRTSLEDQTLQEELEGYRDYAARVRYRLLPGIW